MPLRWRQRPCSISGLAVQGSPTMHCSPTASNSQLRTEERARLKSTTLSTEEGRHNAAPLHRRREAIRKGEVKRERNGERERMRLREAERESRVATHGSRFYSPHSPTSITGVRASRASAQHWQQIQGFLTRN